jgi:proline dehydrogenase
MITNPIEPKTLSFDNTAIAFKHQTNKELKESFWLFKAISNNVLVNIGPFMTKFAMAIKLPITKIIKKTIFKQFCGGETIAECTSTINKLADAGVGTILDYSIEGEEEESVFDHTAQEVIDTIKKAVELSQSIPFCVFKITGIGRFELIRKINNHEELNKLENFEWQKVLSRLENIAKTAFDLQKPLMIDAEESWIQDTIDGLALGLMRKYNHKKAIIYNTYQLYRHDKLASLITDLTVAQAEEFILGAKLVRGAYMEKERKRALELGYESPIQKDKISTDRDYNLALSFCLDNLESVNFVAGTHNQHSCEVLMEKMEFKLLKNNYPHIYFSQLLGMSDNLSFNLSNSNYNVAKYVPYGPVKAVLPYLFRRAEENTAIAGQMSRELKLISTEIKRRGV